MINVVVKLKCLFSFANCEIKKQVSKEDFEKMQKGIGSDFIKVDKNSGIRYHWKVISVEQY